MFSAETTPAECANHMAVAIELDAMDCDISAAIAAEDSSLDMLNQHFLDMSDRVWEEYCNVRLRNAAEQDAMLTTNLSNAFGKYLRSHETDFVHAVIAKERICRAAKKQRDASEPPSSHARF